MRAWRVSLKGKERGCTRSTKIVHTCFLLYEHLMWPCVNTKVDLGSSLGQYVREDTQVSSQIPHVFISTGYNFEYQVRKVK